MYTRISHNLFNGNAEDSAQAHQEFHAVVDYDVDIFKKKIKEALLIWQKNNFNQDRGLAVSPIWLSLSL